MATELRNLRVNRVALVDKGANFDTRTGDGAHILLYKRDDTTVEKDQPGPGDVHVDSPGQRKGKKRRPMPMTDDAKKSFLKRILDALTGSDPDALGAAIRAAASIEKDAPAVSFDAELLRQRMGEILCDVSDHMGALYGVLADILASEAGDKDAQVEAAIDAFATSLKDETDEWLGAPDADDDVAKVGRKISGDRLKRLKDVHQQLGSLISETDATKETAMSQDKTEKAAQDEIAKAAVQKQIDDAVAKAKGEIEAAANERIEKAESLAKAEKDARILKQHEETLRGFAGLPVDPVKDAPVFKALSEKAPEEAARITEILKAADALVAKGNLFAEVGSTRTGTGGDAYGQLEGIAKDKVAKGEAKSVEAGMELAMKARPDLYKQYQKEQQ